MCLAEPAGGIGTATGLPWPSRQSSMRAIMRVMSGTEVTVVFSNDTSDQAGAAQPSKRIRRTGRLEAPSMPEINSTLLARPPQPAWRTVADRHLRGNFGVAQPLAQQPAQHCLPIIAPTGHVRGLLRRSAGNANLGRQISNPGFCGSCPGFGRHAVA